MNVLCRISLLTVAMFGLSLSAADEICFEFKKDNLKDCSSSTNELDDKGKIIGVRYCKGLGGTFDGMSPAKFFGRLAVSNSCGTYTRATTDKSLWGLECAVGFKEGAICGVIRD